MSTPLLAIGLLSKISSVARQGLNQAQKTSAATQGAEAAADRQNVPGSPAKFDLQKLFQSLDLNKDNNLTKDEFKSLAGNLPEGKNSSSLLALQEAGNGSNEFTSKLFSSLDKDGDGQIGKEEFGAIGQGIRGVLRGVGAAGEGNRGAASLGASGLKPASDTSGTDVDRDRLNRAANAYSRTSAPTL